jgi:TetR/AcrR family transcriptional regulator, mexJK operon transcriptional repressor
MPKTAQKTTRARLEEERLEELLDIAADVFIAEGFAAASTNVIARRSNSSKTTFYSRFPTKEHLFVAVIEHRLNKIFADMSTRLPVEPALEETLFEFGLRLLNQALSQKQIALVRVIAMEADRFPQLGQKFFELGPKRGLAILAEYLALQSERGHLEKENPKSMAESFIALLVGGPVLWYILGLQSSLPSGPKQQEHLREVIRLFLRLYRKR